MPGANALLKPMQSRRKRTVNVKRVSVNAKKILLTQLWYQLVLPLAVY